MLETSLFDYHVDSTDIAQTVTHHVSLLFVVCPASKSTMYDPVSITRTCTATNLITADIKVVSLFSNSLIRFPTVGKYHRSFLAIARLFPAAGIVSAVGK